MPMRLLMTADTAGGVWIYALALCRALAPAGATVRLVALGEPDEAQRAAARDLPAVELVVRPCRLEWMPQPWQDLDALAPELLELAAWGGCDLVHLNHLVHADLPWNRPVVTAVHSCVQSWFESVRGEPAPPEWQTYRERVRASLSRADHVVAPSQWMLETASRLYGPLHRRSVIANGSDAPLADPGTTRNGVLAAGRVWDEAKNLEPLMALAPRLSAQLRVAGPRRPPGSGAEAHGVSGTEADGDALPQPALWAEMRRACVFVAPARYEPFGLGALEAARSGCALVLGSIRPYTDLWHGAAVFVDPDRPAQWQQAVERLLQNPEERLALAHAAQRRAAAFTAGRMARCYLALYRRTLRDLAVGA
jgi:glycogen synthase